MNWVECIVVWNHTSDFKVEQACSASLIWNHKYNFRPKFLDSNLQSPLYYIHHELQNSAAQIQDFCSCWIEIFYWSSAELVYKTWKIIVFHFPLIWLVYVNKPWNVIGCCVLIEVSNRLRKRCDLEQKWCNLWISCTNVSQSDCKDH